MKARRWAATNPRAATTPAAEHFGARANLRAKSRPADATRPSLTKLSHGRLGRAVRGSRGASTHGAGAASAAEEAPLGGRSTTPGRGCSSRRVHVLLGSGKQRLGRVGEDGRGSGESWSTACSSVMLGAPCDLNSWLALSPPPRPRYCRKQLDAAPRTASARQLGGSTGPCTGVTCCPRHHRQHR